MDPFREGRSSDPTAGGPRVARLFFWYGITGSDDIHPRVPTGWFAESGSAVAFLAGPKTAYFAPALNVNWAMMARAAYFTIGPRSPRSAASIAS